MHKKNLFMDPRSDTEQQTVCHYTCATSWSVEAKPHGESAITTRSARQSEAIDDTQQGKQQRRTERTKGLSSNQHSYQQHDTNDKAKPDAEAAFNCVEPNRRVTIACNKSIQTERKASKLRHLRAQHTCNKLCNVCATAQISLAPSISKPETSRYAPNQNVHIKSKHLFEKASNE
jgi:hypothetical protein